MGTEKEVTLFVNLDLVEGRKIGALMLHGFLQSKRGLKAVLFLAQGCWLRSEASQSINCATLLLLLLNEKQLIVCAAEL